MSGHEKRLQRVRESADELGRQIEAASNVPLDQYINLTDVRGLHDALSIEEDEVTIEDLERILLVRDGLYAVVETTNDLGEDAEHSIGQLLGALNGLYVNLEALLKSRNTMVEAAKDSVAKQGDSKPIPIAPGGNIAQNVINVSNEVINTVTINQRAIHINILNGVSVDTLRNLRVRIQRLSASAFAVKVHLNAKVIYEGTIKFLTAGADKVMADIRALAEVLKENFNSATDLLKSLEPVINAGTRFVKVVGKLITGVLEDEPELKEVSFKVARQLQSRCLICSAPQADGSIVVAGRGGMIVTVEPSGKTSPIATGGNQAILAIAEVAPLRYAFGTHDGLEIWSPSHTGFHGEQSSFREKIVVIAQQRRRASETLITGASDGGLRRWWRLSQDLEQLRDKDIVQRDVVNRVGRSVQAVVTRGRQVLVATGTKTVVLDEDFDLEREIELGQRINAMCILSDTEVVAVGEGIVAVVDFSIGTFTRILGVPAFVDYVSVVKLNDNLIAVATGDGIVRAIDMKSGAESGEINVGMPVKGLAVAGRYLVVYGGDWNKPSKSLCLVSWEEGEVRIAA
ncbi:MAG: hypothetical protein E5W90_20885 [Mesorhizobium sp.]|nr:MAG: hypothetical protein E5W90_20885 [Mesorhizobium sp.]